MRMDIRYLACLLALLLAAYLLPCASAQTSLGAIVKPTYDLEQGFRFKALYEMGSAGPAVYDVGLYSRIKPTYDLEQGFRFKALYEMGSAASSVYDVGQYSRIKPTYDLEQGYRFRDLYNVGAYQAGPPFDTVATSAV
ncbi:MAG: hypothetical protein JW986_11165 [Methanotrichaceae archaeon]|nr:hypothetical protein [Methanotrichaceae archaeon]